jgi:hypothetical protein
MPEGFGDASTLILTLIESGIPESFLLYQNSYFLILFLCTLPPSGLLITFLHALFHAAQPPLCPTVDFGCLVRLHFSVCFNLFSFRCQIVLPFIFAMHCLTRSIIVAGPRVLMFSYFCFVCTALQGLPTPHQVSMSDEGLKRMRWCCVCVIGLCATPAPPRPILCCAGEHDLPCRIVKKMKCNALFQCFFINIFECFYVKYIMLCDCSVILLRARATYLLGIYLDCLHIITVTVVDILSKLPAKS